MPAHKIDRLLTGRGLARHLGVTENAVREARATGRLDRAVVRQAGRIMFDPTLAEVEWRENVDPLRVAAAKDGLGRPISAKRGLGAGRKRRAPAHGNGNGTGVQQQPGGMAEARARRMLAQARLAELQLERQSVAVSGLTWAEILRLSELQWRCLAKASVHVVRLAGPRFLTNEAVELLVKEVHATLEREWRSVVQNLRDTGMPPEPAAADLPAEGEAP